jgi:group I intron endonuclease
MKINGYIYLLIDKRNGKKYIGKHNGNSKDYFTGGLIPNRIIKLYGKEIFQRIIIEKDINCVHLLSEKEIQYIKKYDTFENGYNLTIGGDGGGSWILNKTDEEKKEIADKKREKTKGVKFSEEHKKKLSESQRKKKLTEEHKQNISNSIKGENHPWFGKKHSEETKKKISISRTGVSNPKHSEWMLKNNPNIQPISIEGVIYNTIREAAENIGLKKNSVKFRVNSESEKWNKWFKVIKNKNRIYEK